MNTTTQMFGRINAAGNVDVLMIADGEAVTRIDANVYPVGSQLSARYEHPDGIVLTAADAKSIGLTIEGSMKKTIVVEARSTFTGKTTTVRAKIRTNERLGIMFAEISKRQVKAAADRVCAAGTDWPRFEAPAGWGDFDEMQDSGYLAIRLASI